ncbi:MAG: hypothetical protein IIZ17_08335 [Eubacteriaceae bacterium]|nr:hypothetical protein [Eubacteriaceae bacterium]
MIGKLRDILAENLKKDMLGAVVGSGVKRGAALGMTDGICDEIGEERVIETGPDGTLALKLALGMAMDGMHPVVFMSQNDLIRSADIIVSNAAMLKDISASQFSPRMLICAESVDSGSSRTVSGIYPEDIYAPAGNVRLIVPASPSRAEALFRECLSAEGINIFMADRSLCGEDSVEEQELTGGKDLTVICVGGNLRICEAACARAKDLGIGCDLIAAEDMSLADTSRIVSSVSQTGRALIVHTEATKAVSAMISTAIMESEAFYYLYSPVRRMCLPLNVKEGTDPRNLIYEEILKAAK